MSLPNRIVQELQPTLQVAAPLNDVQLVALIASHQPNAKPRDAVAWAVDVVLEAIRQGTPRNFADRQKTLSTGGKQDGS